MNQSPVRLPLAVLAAAFLLLPSGFLLAQGPLVPDGGSAPTMKSLQELRDKIGTLETTVASQQSQIAQQGALIGLLATANGVVLPWNVTTVDSTGIVGEDTSLAVTPGSKPAINCNDETNGDLKFAVRQPFVNP